MNQRFSRTLAAMRADIDGLEVQYKDESRLHRAINAMMFWMEGAYLDSYVTTMNRTLWFPSRAYVDKHSPWRVLQHEWVHLKDARSFFGLLPLWMAPLNRILFGLLYLVPPIPAPGRAFIELRAYRRTLELTPESKKGDVLERITGQFAGPDYFWMWPFRRQVRAWLQRESPYRAEMDSVLDDS